MAIVKEIRDGPCVITVHDDCYIGRTQEEVAKIVKEASEIIRHASRIHVDKSSGIYIIEETPSFHMV